jgi:hypothetical protein
MAAWPLHRFEVKNLLNMAFLWPLLALSIFMAFKLAWAVGLEAERVIAEEPRQATNPYVPNPRG